eukprot:2575826-Rhodomonas_salina.3
MISTPAVTSEYTSDFKLKLRWLLYCVAGLTQAKRDVMTPTLSHGHGRSNYDNVGRSSIRSCHATVGNGGLFLRLLCSPSKSEGRGSQRAEATGDACAGRLWRGAKGEKSLRRNGTKTGRGDAS